MKGHKFKMTAAALDNRTGAAAVVFLNVHAWNYYKLL